jgi:tripartite-type tricarboxylate transporter receptor subunit TctC
MRRRQTLLLALCAFAVTGAAGSKADTVADFYKGRAVTVVVSSSAAGGYDTLARALARHIGKHVPGNPAFISATCRAPAG